MSLEDYRNKVKSGEIVHSVKRTNPMERFKAKRTRKNAIESFCFDCMGQCEGYMKEIRECTSPECSLYSYRPYK